jgi:hypothetical protein
MKNNANPRLIRLIYACPNPQITIVKIVAIIFRFPIPVTNAHSELTRPTRGKILLLWEASQYKTQIRKIYTKMLAISIFY